MGVPRTTSCKKSKLATKQRQLESLIDLDDTHDITRHSQQLFMCHDYDDTLPNRPACFEHHRNINIETEPGTKVSAPYHPMT